MTTSATVQAFLFIHLGVVLVATAYYTVGALLAPGLTARSQARFAARPWLPMLVGVAVSVPWVVASLILLNLDAAAFKFVGAAGAVLWVLLGLMGGAGIAQHLGRGQEGWLPAFRGGLLLSLTWALPLVGWLVVLPLSMATGLGCLVIGCVPARKPTPPVAPNFAV
jgi:hypothetical protein